MKTGRRLNTIASPAAAETVAAMFFEPYYLRQCIKRCLCSFALSIVYMLFQAFPGGNPAQQQNNADTSRQNAVDRQVPNHDHALTEGKQNTAGGT